MFFKRFRIYQLKHDEYLQIYQVCIYETAIFVHHTRSSTIIVLYIHV